MKKTPKSTPKTSSSKVEEKALFLINDDYNTFDHVIDCLVAICDHDEIQAEQCAVLVHYKGSCEIAIGKEADLIIVEGKPDQNIDDLSNVRQVYISGNRLV